MSDEATPIAAVVAAPAEVDSARPEVAAAPEVKDDVVKETNGDAEISEPKEVAMEDAPVDSKNTMRLLPFPFRVRVCLCILTSVLRV